MNILQMGKSIYIQLLDSVEIKHRQEYRSHHVSHALNVPHMVQEVARVGSMARVLVKGEPAVVRVIWRIYNTLRSQNLQFVVRHNQVELKTDFILPRSPPVGKHKDSMRVKEGTAAL